MMTTMDGIRSGGECCITSRYAGVAYDNSKIDRIMLKFRPIAPKPVSSGSGSSGGDEGGLFKTSRVKRKYVRGGNSSSSSNKRRKPRNNHHPDPDPDPDPVVTLPLLPEKPDERDLSPAVMCEYLQPRWLQRRSDDLTTVVVPQPVRPVGSCVIVECFTDTFTDEGELGDTDEEKKRRLEEDTCPGFISDGGNKVRWTNEAYRKMVKQEGSSSRPEMVWLVMKERLPAVLEAFACRVRLLYTCKKEKNVLTVPCDVWKMEGGTGGFAWRLDVKAALSLGR